MAKTKATEKSKKPSNSAPKEKAPVAKDAAPAGKEKSASPKAAKSKNDATAKGGSEKKVPAPSIMSGAPAPTATNAPAPSAVLNTPVVANPEDEEIILTDAEGRRYCRATDCDQIGLVDGYCRYHYLYYWKKIQNRKKILADGKLDRYIEELTSRYIDKFVELLRKDLRTEKDFLAAVQELELDGSDTQSSGDDDDAKTYIEEVSGMGGGDSVRDDEGY
jgi:hypothetical protein